MAAYVTAGGAPEAPSRRAGPLQEAAGLVFLLPLGAWWAVTDGGYRPASFLAGLLFLALATAVLLVALPRPPLRRLPLVALVAAAGLTLWTGLSWAWAADRGAAWLDAERAFLYLLAFALPLLWPPSRRVLLGAVLAMVAVGVAGLVAGLWTPGGPAAELARTGRLVEPTGYPNATACLWGMAASSALVLSADARRPAGMRIAGLAVAGALAAGVVLTQSRGGVAVLAVALLFAFVLTPERARLVGAVALVLAAVALALDPLLEVRRLALAGSLEPALERARLLTGAVFLGLCLGGALWIAIERRLSAAPPAVRRRRLAVRGLMLGGVVAAGIALVVVADDPVGWTQERYDSFKQADYASLESSDSRFTGDLGSNRVDYWRASVEIAREHPVTGTGAGSFAAEYLVRRRVDKAPHHAHNQWLETVSDLGVVGLGALLAFAGAAALALLRAWRRRPGERALLVAAGVPAVFVALHASADWVSLFPVLTVAALALLAAAIAEPAASPPRPTSRGRLLVSLAVLLVVAVSAVPVLLSARFTDRAWATWRTQPEAALADARRAQDVDPVSPQPAIAEGIIALETGDRDLAGDGFAEAARRDSSSWYPRFQLGLLASARGDDARARRWLEAAARQNPRETLVSEARRLVGTGRTLDPLGAQRAVLAQRG